MEDFFSFRRMLTPILIEIVFWIGLLTVGIAGLLLLTRGQAIVGLLVWALGFLLVRVYAELLIVIFRINETLTDIRDAVRPTQAAPAAAPSWRAVSSAEAAADERWTGVAPLNPTIAVDPARGTPGTEVSVKLAGFRPAGVEVCWVAGPNSWMLLETVAADAFGNAELRTWVPASASPGGSAGFEARQAGKKVRVAFAVEAIAAETPATDG